MRIRPADSDYPVEYCTSYNVSRSGLYLKTLATHYVLGMTLYLTRDFVEADTTVKKL
jgi:hypothetical protein